jgi:hypothetical protein
MLDVQSLHGDDNDHSFQYICFQPYEYFLLIKINSVNVSAASIWYSYQFISFLLFSRNTFY